MKYIIVFINSFIFLLLISCSSLRQPKTVFQTPDYTEDSVFQNEKKRIAKMKEKTPIQALWLAKLLGDEEIFYDTLNNVSYLLEESYQKKDYLNTIRYYQSLKSVDADKKISFISEKDLLSVIMKDVPGFTVDKNLLPKDIADCINATVTIWVDKGVKFQNGAGFADRVIGSGFFIDKRGYIVTNHHVISDVVDPKHEGYTRLFVKLARDNDKRIPAKVIGYDSVLDLALLKVEIDPPFVLQLGSSSSLSVGDKISAIGTPIGLHGTLTQGIVSAVDRKLFTTGSVMQIDAAINSGNSGGPCIDTDLKVQAIAFAGMLQFQGLNFAIPVEYLKQNLPFMFAGGKRVHGWMGCYGRTKKEGLKETGLEIYYIMPGSSAYRAGLNAGDIINFINGKRVYSLENFQDILRNFTSETILTVNCLREGESKDFSVYLEERPEYPGYEMYKSDLLQNTFIPIFGMELMPSSTISSRRYTVSNIVEGSIADESGFSPLDPVYVVSVSFSDKKSAISTTISTRKRKKGYLDVSLELSTALDSPYYF